MNRVDFSSSTGATSFAFSVLAAFALDALDVDFGRGVAAIFLLYEK
jgi:hypothetical protein